MQQNVCGTMWCAHPEPGSPPSHSPVHALDVLPVFHQVLHGAQVPHPRRLVPEVCGSGGYRGTSLIRNRTLPGPYSRNMPRYVWWYLVERPHAPHRLRSHRPHPLLNLRSECWIQGQDSGCLHGGGGGEKERVRERERKREREKERDEEREKEDLQNSEGAWRGVDARGGPPLQSLPCRWPFRPANMESKNNKEEE